MSNGNGIGARTPDNMYTRSTAAFLVGRSPDTLKRWHKAGWCIPSEKMKAGQLTVFLYTNEDMLRLKELARTKHSGRPKKGAIHPHQGILFNT